VIREVLRSGAKGLVLKTDADQDLIEAVEAVAQKRHFFTKRVADVVLEGYLTGRAVAKEEKVKLTTREREILSLLADGVASKQIALQLNISVRTVESHRIHINRKLGFGSSPSLFAMQYGMASLAQTDELSIRRTAPLLNRAICLNRMPHRLSGQLLRSQYQ
jgi:DNA-binding NarL/FixJ family response regulator